MVTLYMTEDQAKALTFLLGQTAGNGSNDLGYGKMFSRLWNHYGFVSVENARDASESFKIERHNNNKPVTIHAISANTEIDFR